jgi:hypothetical protein
VHWTNLVGSVAMLAFAASLWRLAAGQAEDEGKLVGASPRMTRFRELNLKVGAVFLAAMARGLFVAGFR